jgi:hypothetical protein
MQSPTTRDDISSREESNHVEREATSTLFGVENDLPNRSRACTVMAGNGTRRSSEKYRREVVWKMLFLLQLLLELDTQALPLFLILILFYLKLKFKKKNSSKFK